MSGDDEERLARTVDDAVTRVRRGDAVFLPVTPTMTAAALVAAVRRAAGARTLDVRIDVRPNGVYVAQRAGD
jgi:hypothetical protein